MTVTLTKPGDEITFSHIKSVERVESTSKPGTFRYQIDGTKPDGQGDRTYLNEPVLLKELTHKGIANPEALVGGSFRFWRIAAPNNMPAAGYLNIDVLTPADLKAPAPSKRLTPEAAAGSKVPGDAPPAYHRDVPPAEEPPEYDGLGGALDGPEGDGDALAMPMRIKMNVYFAVAREVAAFQKELSHKHDMPFDGSSVQAMTFSIFNGR